MDVDVQKKWGKCKSRKNKKISNTYSFKISEVNVMDDIGKLPLFIASKTNKKNKDLNKQLLE